MGCSAGTKAAECLESIAPLAELLRFPQKIRFPYLLPDGQRAETWTEIVRWCARRNGRSVGTTWRTFAKFKRGGAELLQRRERSDKGISRFFSRHLKAAAFAAYLRLAWRQTFREIHEAIQRDRDLLEISRQNAPSYRTVSLWLRSESPLVVALALEGQKIHRERISAFARRGLMANRRGRNH
jgi:hypothetical protein